MATPTTDPVREATERAILRERILLHGLFAPRVAAALDRYFSETMMMGMVTDTTRRRLAELLAERGLADPDGRATVTSINTVTGDNDVKAAYHLSEVARHRMTLDTFRAEYHRRRRESIKPLTAREYAETLSREHPLEAAGSPLRRSLAWVRGIGRGKRQRG